jgi:hypothetical protein
MRRATWRVAVLFAALTVLMTAPLSLHPATRVASTGADTELMLWTLAWDAHAILTHPLSIFDANIFFPFHDTLAYSENLIGSLVVAGPVIWLTHNPVLAMNLVVLVATILCGFGAYLLGRRLGFGEPAAIICGLVFAFVPPRLSRLDQVHIATIQWIPFALAYLHSYLTSSRARDLRVAIAFFSLQALTSGHGASFLVLGILIVLIAALWQRVPLTPLARLKDVGVPGLVLLAPAAFIYLPYRAAQHDIGLRRPLEDWTPLSGSSFVTSPAHAQTWLIDHLPAGVWHEPPDAWLFPGVLVLVLAAAAFGPAPAPATRDRAWRWAYLAMAIVSVWLAIGPPFGIWRWIYWLPGLNFVRVPSRFMMLGMLALAVLAGFGVDRIVGGLQRRTLATFFVAAALLAEFTFVPLAGMPYRVELPSADRWLDSQPKPFGVVDLPLTDSASLIRREERAALFMVHSMAHWQPIVEGYSGTSPPPYGVWYDTLTHFPDDASLKLLKEIGVRYAVVHVDLIPPTERGDFEQRVSAAGDRIVLEYKDDAGRVYRIR